MMELLKNIYGDERRFIQIIQNFLSNAVKFSHENTIIKIRTTLIESQKIPSPRDKLVLYKALNYSLRNTKDKGCTVNKLYNIEYQKSLNLMV